MMNTFIRVAEIWVPDSDGYLLEFGGGVYDNAPDFGAVSRSMCLQPSLCRHNAGPSYSRIGS